MLGLFKVRKNKEDKGILSLSATKIRQEFKHMAKGYVHKDGHKYRAIWVNLIDYGNVEVREQLSEAGEHLLWWITFSKYEKSAGSYCKVRCSAEKLEDAVREANASFEKARIPANDFSGWQADYDPLGKGEGIGIEAYPADRIDLEEEDDVRHKL